MDSETLTHELEISRNKIIRMEMLKSQYEKLLTFLNETIRIIKSSNVEFVTLNDKFQDPQNLEKNYSEILKAITDGLFNKKTPSTKQMNFISEKIIPTIQEELKALESELDACYRVQRGYGIGEPFTYILPGRQMELRYLDKSIHCGFYDDTIVMFNKLKDELTRRGINLPDYRISNGLCSLIFSTLHIWPENVTNLIFYGQNITPSSLEASVSIEKFKKLGYDTEAFLLGDDIVAGFELESKSLVDKYFFGSVISGGKEILKTSETYKFEVRGYDVFLFGITINEDGIIVKTKQVIKKDFSTSDESLTLIGYHKFTAEIGSNGEPIVKRSSKHTLSEFKVKEHSDFGKNPRVCDIIDSFVVSNEFNPEIYDEEEYPVYMSTGNVLGDIINADHRKSHLKNKKSLEKTI
jgi:hypothetical protein